MLDGVGHTLPGDLRDEESAVEQDGVGSLARAIEKRVQMLGNRRIRDIRQAELAEQAALLLFGEIAALGDWKEAF